MLTRDEIDSLPDDPDLALAEIADILAAQIEPAMAGNSFDGREARSCWEDVNAYLRLHDLRDKFAGLTVRPPPQDGDGFWEWWHEFYANLRTARTTIYMEQKRDGNTVALSAEAKRAIHAKLNEIRELIEKLNIPSEQRERILRMLSKFQGEVDQTRTAIVRWLSAAYAWSRFMRTAGEDAKPIADRFREVTGIIVDSEESSRPQLPRRTTKQIPRRPDLDDDIPF